MGLGFAGGTPLMLLADAFAIGFDLVGGLCVAVVWPWLAGSSVLSAMQAQPFMDITVYSISSATPFSFYETHFPFYFQLLEVFLNASPPLFKLCVPPPSTWVYNRTGQLGLEKRK